MVSDTIVHSDGRVLRDSDDDYSVERAYVEVMVVCLSTSHKLCTERNLSWLLAGWLASSLENFESHLCMEINTCLVVPDFSSPYVPEFFHNCTLDEGDRHRVAFFSPKSTCGCI